uniref:Condensin complex subunit 2 n=1 Tax=Physcomitrium patens TaxID=3218 RepID=A0A2K1KAB9_PHYPA|nr:hypothetical protein PHYPA_009907 [Physcomitrium patens]
MRTPLKDRAVSPGQGLLLMPHDDEEQAQVRRARAAALGRKSGIGAGVFFTYASASASQESNLLCWEHILELHKNCIKLAAENVEITQSNTWDLKLIDHLSALVQGDDEQDDQDSFQKASCTLEAGVKIYSTRVDSVHFETYKVLSSLNRTAGVNNGSHSETSSMVLVVDGHVDCQQAASNQEEHRNCSSKRSSRTSSTLEASFDSLNVKQIDLAFAVDPLFQQTSALFDEGGAKGLLLNSLSIFQGCEIVFDSWEVPERSMLVQANNDAEQNAAIKLCFIKAMLEHLRKDSEISPSSSEIVKMLDDPYRTTTLAEDAAKQSCNLFVDGDVFSSWQIGDTSDNSVNDADEAFDCTESDEHQEVNYLDEGLEAIDDDIDANLLHGSNPELGDEEGVGGGEVEYTEDGSVVNHTTVQWMNPRLIYQSNAWAGPDHCKYRNPQDGIRGQCKEEISGPFKVKRKKRQPLVIDFENPSEIDLSLFNPAQVVRSTVLSQRRASFNGLLPDDVHYEALDLVHLFLRPSVLRENLIADRQIQRNIPGPSVQDYGYNSGDDSGMDCSHGDWTGIDGDGEIGDPLGTNLVAVRRKIQKVKVNDDETSKQVDVRNLKESLWSHLQNIQATIDEGESEKDARPFQNLLNVLPEDYAATESDDVSVQLCFICLLHLANEHNLRIVDCPTMDDLQIFQV